MSTTLLRLGLWIILLVVGIYVLQQTLEESPLVEFFNESLMAKGLMLGGALLAVGFVSRLFEKTVGKTVVRSHCAVCRTPVPKGAIYCRQHLRSVLEREDDRTHATRIRR
jgi:predicted nucleic acid-binding Zn ribbon protein